MAKPIKKAAKLSARAASVFTEVAADLVEANRILAIEADVKEQEVLRLATEIVELDGQYAANADFLNRINELLGVSAE